MIQIIKAMLKLKNVFLIITSFFFITPSFCQGYEKLSEDKVDQNKVLVAKNFADKFFSTVRDGKTYECKDEATEMLSQRFTPEVQKQVYQDIQGKFGDYKSLEYAETWKYSGTETMTIVRFKGIFSKSNEIPEIRIVLDQANKVAGFWYKPWEAELK
jgi:hypothetical protein